MNKHLLRLTYSAMLIGMGILLPFITASNMQLGNMFCLMHIPVLLCGFVCGWQWGLAAGVVTPLLRHLITGMPKMPTAGFMAAELAAYGLFCGIFCKLLPKKNYSIYLSLVLSLLLGRAVNGTVQFALLGMGGGQFGLKLFLTNAFVTSLPGIALQLILVPLLVMTLKRTGLLLDDQ